MRAEIDTLIEDIKSDFVKFANGDERQIDSFNNNIRESIKLICSA